jgi:hypothetical protein
MNCIGCQPCLSVEGVEVGGAMVKQGRGGECHQRREVDVYLGVDGEREAASRDTQAFVESFTMSTDRIPNSAGAYSESGDRRS